MSKIKPRNPRIFQQMELGAGGTAWAISEQARKNPKQNFLATDFKFVNERKYLRENARYGAKPFPPNLHLARGGALTVIKRLKQSGRKTLSRHDRQHFLHYRRAYECAEGLQYRASV